MPKRSRGAKTSSTIPATGSAASAAPRAVPKAQDGDCGETRSRAAPAASCRLGTGYAEIARLICPVVEQYQYGKTFPHPVTPPNLQRVFYTGEDRDELALEFDQPVVWSNALKNQFTLDDQSAEVISGRVIGRVLTLKLAAATHARTITYLDSRAWSENNLLYGQNGIAALTFCEVPVNAPLKPNRGVKSRVLKTGE